MEGSSLFILRNGAAAASRMVSMRSGMMNPYRVQLAVRGMKTISTIASFSRKSGGFNIISNQDSRNGCARISPTHIRFNSTKPENDKPKLNEQEKKVTDAVAAATAPVSTAAAGTVKRKSPIIFRIIRVSWRIIKYSILAAIGFVAYELYSARNPGPQATPDPNKKTLVILGTGWGSASLLKTLDTSNYNVIIVSPRNYFMFTPLLPSCTVGTIEPRSIMEPIRDIMRHKQAKVIYYEAEATKIDHVNRKVSIKTVGDLSKQFPQEDEISFDYLVVGVGAENGTFGIPGVRENACFLKEIPDAQKIRKRIMDCIETASLGEVTPEERKRLLHAVVVGGGPTGVEFAGELQDFFEQDLRKWIPNIEEDFKVTLIEALPNVLPSFNKDLIDFTETTLKAEKITVHTKTMVKGVDETIIKALVTKPDGTKELTEIPYGLLVWATGNAIRPVTKDLITSIGAAQKNSRRGLLVNEYLVVEGTEGIYALGDCSSTKYAPTAQVASQEGSYLARLLNQIAHKQTIEQEISRLEQLGQETINSEDRKSIVGEIESKSKQLRKMRILAPFQYSHQGSLAYIGMDQAVAEVNFWEGKFRSFTGGRLTYLFWRSAYLSMVFSTRNRLMVTMDWIKVKLFGRDVGRE